MIRNKIPAGQNYLLSHHLITSRDQAEFQHRLLFSFLWLTLIWQENPLFYPQHVSARVFKWVKVCMWGCKSVFLPHLGHTCEAEFPACVYGNIKRSQKHFLIKETPVASLDSKAWSGLRFLVGGYWIRGTPFHHHRLNMSGSLSHTHIKFGTDSLILQAMQIITTRELKIHFKKVQRGDRSSRLSLAFFSP